jgi:hypothetical protein
MAKVYKVSFTLTVADDGGHPRKWIPDALWPNLNTGEDIDDYVFEEVPQAEEAKE